MADKTKQILRGLVKGGFPQYLMQPYFAKLQTQGEQRKSAQEMDKERFALLGRMMAEGAADIPAESLGAMLGLTGVTTVPSEERAKRKQREYSYYDPMSGKWGIKTGAAAPKILPGKPETYKDRLLKRKEAGETLTPQEEKLAGIYIAPKEATPESMADLTKIAKEAAYKRVGMLTKNQLDEMNESELEDIYLDAFEIEAENYGLPTPERRKLFRDPTFLEGVADKIKFWRAPTPKLKEKTEIKIPTQERFNQLIKEGKSENQAYKELIDEGY